jgi:HPt (histidine-containing phosphotransfer) domain-containing protein
LLAVFASELPGWITALRTAVEQCCLEEVLQRAHDIKGAAANIGADSVAHAARSFERAALGPQASKALRELERAADAVTLFVEKHTALEMIAMPAS